MSDLYERFKARNDLLSKPADTVLGDIGMASMPEVQFDVTAQSQDPLWDFGGPADEDRAAAELEAERNDILALYTQQCRDRLIEGCRKEVQQKILSAFGLGQIIAAYDKVGGNVDTIHNVRKQIWATEAEKKRYDDRVGYKEKVKDYRSRRNYTKAYKEANKTGAVTDYLTGTSLEQQERQLDHKISAEEHHENPELYLAEIDPIEMANRPENLGFTHKTINQSKQEDAPSGIGKKRSNLETERTRLLAVQERNGTLTQNQQEALRNLDRKITELERVDEGVAEQETVSGRKRITGEASSKYYTSAKFYKRTAITSASDGIKMGAQQAAGVLLSEFFDGLVEEVIDWHRHGRKEQHVVVEIRQRLERLSNRILARWRDALDAGWKGLISGILSNLITVILNTFLTTSRNIVRMIREGIGSVFRAVLLLVRKPDAMTWEEALHEASKLLLTGSLVVGGIALEEALKTSIGPLFATLLSGVVTTVVTGLAVYALEEADPFGVEQDKRIAFLGLNIRHKLEEQSNQRDALSSDLANLSLE